MSPGAKLPSQAAALAGVPAGVQSIGPWAGRRQLFVKFATEAETATIYTAAALRSELKRLAARSPYHSVAVAGRDPLAEQEYLGVALADAPLPVMLDHDGQRPDELSALLGLLSLVQVSLDGTETDVTVQRAVGSLERAAGKGVAQALVLLPADGASDARLLRIVEQAHAASADAAVVLHPPPASLSERDRRWAAWLERAVGLHADIRVFPSVPAPTGTR